MSSHAASRAVTRVSNSLLARTPRKKRNAKRLATNRLRHDDLELPKVLLETPGLLGVFKPASYAIQGGEHRANAEKWHMFVSALQAEYGTVYAVDRLEAGTSGALLFARNAGQSRRLQRLAEKKGGLYKTFLALTYGDLTSSEAWAKAPPVMMSDGSMGRKVVGHFRKDEDQTRRCPAADVAGEELVTHISIVETSSDERFRLLRLEPQSLVRHGLRAQLAIQLKAPIAGDYKYAQLYAHKTFDFLKYQGTFSLALHCLDVQVPTYEQAPTGPIKNVQGVYAAPEDDFAEACRKAGITTLDKGYIRFGGPRGKWAPTTDALALASASGEAPRTWYGKKTSNVPAIFGRRDGIRLADPAVKLETPDTSPFDRLFADKSMQTQAYKLERRSEDVSMERERARQRFDPSRRAAEAVDPAPIPSTSLVTLDSPLPPSSRSHSKLANEQDLVNAGRLSPGALIGMMELRRRRAATRRALVAGQPVPKNRAPMRLIQKKPFVGISAEYSPLPPTRTFSPKQTIKAARKKARGYSEAGPPGSSTAASTVPRRIKALQRDAAEKKRSIIRAGSKGRSSRSDILSPTGKPQRSRKNMR